MPIYSAPVRDRVLAYFEHLLVDELICTCSLSFSLYPGLTYGASTALEGYADADVAKLFEEVDLFIVVPRLVEILSGFTDLTVRHG